MTRRSAERFALRKGVADRIVTLIRSPDLYRRGNAGIKTGCPTPMMSI